MPGTYIPKIETFPNGVVTVKSVDPTSYEEILMSLGTTIYEVLALYYKGLTISQISQPFEFQCYDVNGNISAYVEVIAVDPYQFQSAININLENKRMVFDGQLYYELPLERLQTVYMFFDVIQRSATDQLPPTELPDDFFNHYNSRMK